MVRINLSISENILKKVDNYRKLVQMTRSGLVTEAIESYFIELEDKILEDRKNNAIKDIISIRERIGKELRNWDSTMEIRELRDSRWGGSTKR